MLQIISGLNPCFPADLKYKVVSAMDVPWENLSKYFESCIRFIKTAIKHGGGCLVHCYGGVSRSATIVIAYLMSEHKMGMFEALNFVKVKRSAVFPNPGFQR